jgi:D-alanyl-D-alanine carboxypeptidase/D-alanyl-D-alanine-endopeptidase (penicillin-binding protein 4)
MKKGFLILLSSLITIPLFPQEVSAEKLFSDSSMLHASVSLCIADAITGSTVIEFNSVKSLVPASVQKLITSAVALEMLGPQYTFKTQVGYSGTFDTVTGLLKGNIIIKGGGDPALGSENFSEHYKDFLGYWTGAIIKLGIKKIDGRVITDDSYFDYQPVPPKWLWEDEGNYYGAGAYGLSVFDNTYQIHLNTTSSGNEVKITSVHPYECSYDLTNRLVASGSSDEGYIFASPYSKSGWIEGSVPAGVSDLIIKASVPDPPLLIARMLTNKLTKSGITLSGEPSSLRIERSNSNYDFVFVAETTSPPLSDIAEVLNHQSVNLYAEHLIKELGKQFGIKGSTAAGVEVIKKFLRKEGVNTDGLFMEDGSGLSPLNAVSARELSDVLIYMNTRGKYFTEYFESLPEAGKEGTLKYHFRDPAFDSRLRAKSGSMTRVRSYAGYFTTIRGNKMVFSIIINNFSGTSSVVISGIEDILKQIILNN